MTISEERGVVVIDPAFCGPVGQAVQMISTRFLYVSSLLIFFSLHIAYEDGAHLMISSMSVSWLIILA
jgi:hypothetical protein